MERSQTNCTKQIKWWTTISVLPGMFHKERIGLNNMSTWSRCMLTRISCMSTWFILNVGAEVCYQRNTIMCFFFLLGYIDFLVYAHDLVPAKVVSPDTRCNSGTWSGHQLSYNRNPSEASHQTQRLCSLQELCKL